MAELAPVSVCGWVNVSADTLLTTRPCLLYKVILLASAAGGDATLYEGRDATSGRKIVTLKGSANVSNDVRWDTPLYCPRGLYLDVGSNVTEVHVAFVPLSSELDT